jgi:hypothetical protein
MTAPASKLFTIGGFRIGARIILSEAIGPRLANRHGTVIGGSAYKDSLRVVLDGSKTPITLHQRYFRLMNNS